MEKKFVEMTREEMTKALTLKPNATLTPILENCFKSEFVASANNFILYLSYLNKYRQVKAKYLKLQALKEEKALKCEELTKDQRDTELDLVVIMETYEKEFLAKYDASNPFEDDTQATYICMVCASYISKVWTVVDGTSELYKLISNCHKENIDTYNGKNPYFKAVYGQLEVITNSLNSDDSKYLVKRRYNVSSTETKFFIGTMVVVKPDKAKHINLQLKSEKAFRNDVITCLYGKLQGQKLDTIQGLKSE